MHDCIRHAAALLPSCRVLVFSQMVRMLDIISGKCCAGRKLDHWGSSERPDGPECCGLQLCAHGLAQT